MRQVPDYLVIGSGRVAQHFQHYFTLMQIPFSSWHRQQDAQNLQEKLQRATHVLLLISDRAIENFIDNYLENCNSMLIHFSGSLVTEKAYGAHPLFTFNQSKYSLEQYQAIPFILDHDAPDFEALFPQLPNLHVRLNKNQKAKYHALCVLSGNFSCMLWQKIFSEFENSFKIPQTIAHPYLQQVMHNLLNDSRTAMTGPLVRGDTNTIQNNLAALDSDSFQDIYKSFVECYQKQKEEI